jgi:hypothetical protein
LIMQRVAKLRKLIEVRGRFIVMGWPEGVSINVQGKCVTLIISVQKEWYVGIRSDKIKEMKINIVIAPHSPCLSLSGLL